MPPSTTPSPAAPVGGEPVLVCMQHQHRHSRNVRAIDWASINVLEYFLAVDCALALNVSGTLVLP